MKITDADYEDHIAKLESGFKATFGEDLAPYLVTGVCFDLLAAKKMNYVKSYLQTWSGMELFNLADRMLKRGPTPGSGLEETSMPPGLSGVVTSGQMSQSRGLAKNGDLEKAVEMAAELNKSLQASVAQGLRVTKEKKTLISSKAGGGTVSSIDKARAKKLETGGKSVGPETPPRK